MSWSMGSELLVVENLRVDGDQSALALLLLLHDAVDGRQDAVAEELVAAFAEGVAVDADQFQQASGIGLSSAQLIAALPRTRMAPGSQAPLPACTLTRPRCRV